MVAKEAAARPDLRFATGLASRPGRWVGLIAVLAVDVDGLGPAEASPVASPPGVVEVAVENAAGRRLDTQLVPVRSSGGAVDVLAPIREVGTVGEGSPLPLRLQPL
jgi:hypothetical protein